MGNYSTGISIISTYSKEKTFLQNAQAVHKLIYAKLDSPKEKYMLYEFMTLLNPSLIDSIYFTLAGKYQKMPNASLVFLPIIIFLHSLVPLRQSMKRLKAKYLKRFVQDLKNFPTNILS